jgi:hypothetical protein
VTPAASAMTPQTKKAIPMRPSAVVTGSRIARCLARA